MAARPGRPLFTRSGDDGSTSLGGGPRVPKDHPRVEAYGTLDELGSLLGMALAAAEPLPESLRERLRAVQGTLLLLAARLATPDPGHLATLPALPAASIPDLEEEIQQLSDALPPLRTFLLPGGCMCAAILQTARTVCRRAERRLITLQTCAPIEPAILVYLNRLSDWLFVLARTANQHAGVAERPWEPR
ncbi:MAG: cob(I)yrinic acid a,c-diamide adenosyltransferase [Myxococcota bacterium]|nr:cob(I)yrinic acid a,c-diamide adenosyltransferase [Myxococcota bacterium]